MKEIKVKISSIMGNVTILLVSLIVSGSAIYIGMQYNQSQKEIAEIQASAEKETANKTKEGLSNIGRGACVAGKNRATCTNYEQ